MSSRISATQLRALTRRSDRAGLTRLAGHLSLLGVTTGLVVLASAPPTVAVALFAHGVVLVFLFAPLHECLHRTAFRSRWLNEAIALVAGFVLLLPPRWFRAFHLEHHRHTQDSLRDPELPKARLDSWPAWFLHVSGLPTWGRAIAMLARNARGQVDAPYVPAAQRAVVACEARCFVLGYVAVAAVTMAFGSTVALWFWVLPLLLGQPVLRLYLLAEHTGCEDVEDALRNSRTTRSNALVRYLAWNMPYHAEHHAYAAVPFHALPALHAELSGQHRYLAGGYLVVNQALLPGARWPATTRIRRS